MSDVSIQAAITGLDEEETEQFLNVIDSLSATDPSVVITHVYDEEDRDTLSETFDINLDEPSHLDTIAEHNTGVQDLAGALDERGIEYIVRGSLGDPTAEILHIAKQEDVDFILIGGHERSPAGKAIFGSTSQEILLSSSRPVIYVKPYAGD